MQTTFPYLQITKHDRAIVGKKDPNTRIYRFSGVERGQMRRGAERLDDDKLDPGGWFDGLCKRFPLESFVSPGGVSMYVPVSRAAVYQRINAGKLTTFCYHPTETTRTLFGNLRKTRKTPYMFIPVSECKAWAEELKRRLEPNTDPGWLPNQQFDDEERKLRQWPKHHGQTSEPKWQRKVKAAKKPWKGKLLSVVALLLPGVVGASR